MRENNNTYTEFFLKNILFDIFFFFFGGKFFFITIFFNLYFKTLAEKFFPLRRYINQRKKVILTHFTNTHSRVNIQIMYKYLYSTYLINRG